MSTPGQADRPTMMRRLVSAAGSCCVVLSLTAAASAAWAEDPAAAANGCPDGPAPQIRVVTDIAETAYDHSVSIGGLGRLHSNQNASGHTLGLTRQLFTKQETAQVRTVPQQDGSVCVGFTDGSIVLEMKTFIFVVSELAVGSCLYEQVLAHEERHAKVGRRLFGEFAETFAARLADVLRKTPYVRVADEMAVAAAARARMKEIFEPLYRDFRSVYRKRQAIIDTSGEYVRVREACPGELEKLVAQ